MPTPVQIELCNSVSEVFSWLDYKCGDRANHGEDAHWNSSYAERAQMRIEELTAAMQGEGMGEERLNRAYSERVMCSVGLARMAIANGFKAGTGLDAKGQAVLYVDTPNGQVSWHIWDVDQWMLEGLPIYDGEWDGEFRGRDGKWCIWQPTHPQADASAESVARECAVWREAYEAKCAYVACQIGTGQIAATTMRLRAAEAAVASLAQAPGNDGGNGNGL